MSKNLHKTSAVHLPALLMLILLALFPARLSAKDYEAFEYTYQGQTIKYWVLSEDKKIVATKPGYTEGNKVIGSLVLPSKVVNGDTEYTLVEIDDSSFKYNYDLTSITIPETVTSIDQSAFYYCTGLKEVVIPNSVTSIGQSAFYNCEALTSITIPEGVKAIESYTFSGCENLSSVNLPTTLVTIGEHAFGGCSMLKSIDIPNSVVSIKKSAFSGCSMLKSIDIPNSVHRIEERAFSDCSAVESVTIGNSVYEIGEKAFFGLKSLKNLYSWATTPPSLGSRCFSDNHYSGVTLHVPAESVEAYSKAEMWEYFDNIVGDVESTGIEGIEADGSNAPVEYFNLNGMRVSNPENGLYIKRQGGKSTKVLVK